MNSARKAKRKQTQVELLLTLLLEGSMTRVKAMHYGIMNLTARVSDLRSRGFDVVCTMKIDQNGNKYGSFEIPQEPQDDIWRVLSST